MGLSFSAGGTGWAAVELKPKSIWVVQPYEFLVSVMVDLDPAMPQTSTIQMLDQFSQCCRRANAECKVIQPGLFLVVGSGDSLHRQGKEKSRLSHDVYQRTFALGYWGTQERSIKGPRCFQVSDTKDKMVYVKLLQYGAHDSVLPASYQLSPPPLGGHAPRLERIMTTWPM
jgi:hypothetical protein